MKNEDSNLTQVAERLLKDKKEFLIKQKNTLVYLSEIIMIILFALLILVFFVFSTKITWINLDVNSTKLLWIIVIMDIAGLVWTAMSTFQQLKRYNTCIRKLDTLLFRVAITNESSDTWINGDKIYEEMQSIMNVFDKKRTNE